MANDIKNFVNKLERLLNYFLLYPIIYGQGYYGVYPKSGAAPGSLASIVKKYILKLNISDFDKHSSLLLKFRN